MSAFGGDGFRVGFARLGLHGLAEFAPAKRPVVEIALLAKRRDAGLIGNDVTGKQRHLRDDANGERHTEQSHPLLSDPDRDDDDGRRDERRGRPVGIDVAEEIREP